MNLYIWRNKQVEDDSRPPTHRAVEHGELRELSRLLDAGADPNEVWSNATLLASAIDVEADGAIQTERPFDAACTAVLLAYGADPELPDTRGEAPRMFAYRYGHGPAVRLLEAYIERTRGEPVPDPCPKLPPGQPKLTRRIVTLAHRAVEYGELEELTRVLDTGTDPNEVWSHRTLLTHAIEFEAGGPAQTGQPLEAACTAVLLAYGADPELPDPQGDVPMLLAHRYGHGPAVRLLEAHIEREGEPGRRGRPTRR